MSAIFVPDVLHDLSDVKALSRAADRLVYYTGATTLGLTTFTAVARTLLSQSTQADMRTTGLGLGTMSMEYSANYYDSGTSDSLFTKNSVVGAIVAKLVATSNLSQLNTGETIDGVTVAAGDYILCAGQTNVEQNGLFQAEASDDWTRVVGFDGTSNLGGRIVTIRQGTAGAGKSYRLSGTVGGSISVTEVAAAVPIGTSGATVPLLNGTNTFSAAQTLGASSTTLGDATANGFSLQHSVGGGVLAIRSGNNGLANIVTGRIRAEPSASGSPTIQISGIESSVDLGSAVSLSWANGTAYNNTRDVGFIRSAAGVLTLNDRNSSNDVAYRFARRSSTTDNTQMGRQTFSMPVTTHASYTSRYVLLLTDSGGDRTIITADANGSAPLIGFLGATAVVRQSIGAAATDAASTQTLANNIRTALINLGLCST